MKFRPVAAFAAGVLALGVAGSASAALLTYESALEYRDTGSGVTKLPNGGKFGLVTIQELSSTMVEVTVELETAGSLFINTGGPHDPFLYNLLEQQDADIQAPVGSFYDAGRNATPGTGLEDVGGFNATPFGGFTNKIGCCSTTTVTVTYPWHWENVTTTTQECKTKKGVTTCTPVTTTTKKKVNDPPVTTTTVTENNGASNGQKPPLVFRIEDTSGITFAGQGATYDDDGRLINPGEGPDNRFFSNAGGWWFTADIYDAATGQTYNVAAKDAFCLECVTTHEVPGVPEPATWAMMIIGFGAMGSVIRRRRRVLAL